MRFKTPDLENKNVQEQVAELADRFYGLLREVEAALAQVTPQKVAKSVANIVSTDKAAITALEAKVLALEKALASDKAAVNQSEGVTAYAGGFKLRSGGADKLVFNTNGIINADVDTFALTAGDQSALKPLAAKQKIVAATGALTFAGGSATAAFAGAPQNALPIVLFTPYGGTAALAAVSAGGFTLTGTAASARYIAFWQQ